MKGLDRGWQVILEEREKDGRKRRSLAAIKLIKTSFVLRADYSSSHASATKRNNKVDGSLDGGMKERQYSLLPWKLQLRPAGQKPSRIIRQQLRLLAN